MKDMQSKLLELCANYGVKLSDVAIRYALDHPDITTTIVGMCDLSVITQNVSVLDFRIPDGLLDEIETLVAPVKNQMWYEGKAENNI